VHSHLDVALPPASYRGDAALTTTANHAVAVRCAALAHDGYRLAAAARVHRCVRQALVVLPAGEPVVLAGRAASSYPRHVAGPGRAGPAVTGR
jgi:hypothetical protein